MADKGWLPRWYEENLRGRLLCRTSFNWNKATADAEILVADSIMFHNLHVLDLATFKTSLLVDVPGKLGDVKVSPEGRNVAWTGAATLRGWTRKTYRRDTFSAAWDLMLDRCPILYADQSKTPLLILHGDSDPRVHPSQSQEIYRALKMAGHPAVRLV